MGWGYRQAERKASLAVVGESAALSHVASSRRSLGGLLLLIRLTRLLGCAGEQLEQPTSLPQTPQLAAFPHSTFAINSYSTTPLLSHTQDCCGGAQTGGWPATSSTNCYLSQRHFHHHLFSPLYSSYPGLLWGCADRRLARQHFNKVINFPPLPFNRLHRPLSVPHPGLLWGCADRRLARQHFNKVINFPLRHTPLPPLTPPPPFYSIPQDCCGVAQTGAWPANISHAFINFPPGLTQFLPLTAHLHRPSTAISHPGLLWGCADRRLARQHFNQFINLLSCPTPLP